MHVRRDDTVVVLSGRDKGKSGKVLSVEPKSEKLVIEGISIGKRHKKPRKQGDPGGIIKMETPIYACKVMRVCPKCDKPTRHAVQVTEEGKHRVCKKCDASI